MNLLFFPVVALSALLFVVGYRISLRTCTPRVSYPLLIVACLCALPGVLFAVYYLHWFDNAVWFYRFRSWPYSELTASGLGLIAGVIQAWTIGKGALLRALMPGLLMLGLFVPYMKPVVTPLDPTTFTADFREGVCLQSTPSTCGPASVASILRMFGVNETEETLAREAHTSASGTENWYLARALRRRGFAVRFVVVEQSVVQLPFPSVAGVLLPGDFGHFISVLDETDTTYVIGDPMVGRVYVSKASIGDSYEFTGFFMVVEKQDSHHDGF